MKKKIFYCHAVLLIIHHLLSSGTSFFILMVCMCVTFFNKVYMCVFCDASRILTKLHHPQLGTACDADGGLRAPVVAAVAAVVGGVDRDPPAGRVVQHGLGQFDWAIQKRGDDDLSVISWRWWRVRMSHVLILVVVTMVVVVASSGGRC